MSDQALMKAKIEDVILPSDAGRDRLHRLGKFAAWMRNGGRPWYDVDLAGYRDELIEGGLAPSSVSAHLSTVRARYRELLRSDARRDELYTLAGRKLGDLGQADTPANRKALVDERLTRIRNHLDPAAAPVRELTSQDTADEAHLRLTPQQAQALLTSPGFNTLRGLRDSAAIGLMLCTGVREGELSALEVRDLRRHLGGELALHVREGKGCKERLIPYGELDWVLVIVEAWLAAAGVEDGFVLRGYYKGFRTARPGPLSVRGIQYLLKRYPIAVDGELVAVKPHDLRRTYARLLYGAGMDPVRIQQNLGHADLQTTLGYIGTLDGDQRRPPAIFSVDLSGLYQQERMV